MRYFSVCGVCSAGVLLIVSCGSTELVEVEANPPLLHVQAMQNYDKYFDQLNGSSAELDKLRQMIARKQQAALALGEKLFKNPRFSRATLGRSCNTCHVNGGTTGGSAIVPRSHGRGPFNIPIPSLTHAAATFPKYSIAANAVISLAQMNNTCLAIFVGGDRIPMNGPEAYALETYIASIGEGQTVHVGEGAVP